ncbi:MAG: hypothetical protein ACQETA_02610, partial [Bacteroidota bacterium]
MQRISTYFFLVLFFLPASWLEAQKKPLTLDDIESWKRITERVISDDGDWIAYKTEPWRGDPKVWLYNKDGSKVFESDRGSNIKITDDSDFLIFTVVPAYEHVRELKLKKTKKEDMPGDILAIYNIDSGKLDSLKEFRNYKIPGEWASYIAYQLEPAEKDKDDEKAEDETGDADKEKLKEESGKNGYMLHLRNLENGGQMSWPFVTEYDFAEKSSKLIFVSTGDDKEFTKGIYLYDLEKSELVEVMTGDHQYKQLSMDENAGIISFLAKSSEDKDSEYSLYLWSGDMAEEIVNNTDPAFPGDWKISENGRISFSDNGRRIFFGTAPERPERDTTILDEEYPDVE